MIKIKKNPETLGYEQSKNIIKVENAYYLIAQVDYDKMVLFKIKGNMPWNRYVDPVSVNWATLNTHNIQEVCPDFKDKKVERVVCNITFEILNG